MSAMVGFVWMVFFDIFFRLRPCWMVGMISSGTSLNCKIFVLLNCDQLYIEVGQLAGGWRIADVLRPKQFVSWLRQLGK